MDDGRGDWRREGMGVAEASKSEKESDRVPKICWWDGGI
jgi:hypothetical protein